MFIGVVQFVVNTSPPSLDVLLNTMFGAFNGYFLITVMSSSVILPLYSPKTFFIFVVLFQLSASVTNCADALST